MKMRYFGLLALAATFALAQAPNVRAAERGQGERYEQGQRSISEFAQFLSNHPWIAHKLWQKPSRANSKDFRGDNPELKYWLRNHPAARNQIRMDANSFMARVRDFERSGATYRGYGSYGPWRNQATQAQMARFSQFLDDNPGLAHQLAHNPSLVNDPGYLRHHKELRDFLASHPAVQSQLAQNPSSFVAWYGSYDWYSRKH
ncbi:MAG: hypothetical protein ACRD3D_02570 [Terriglobia bacterium]